MGEEKEQQELERLRAQVQQDRKLISAPPMRWLRSIAGNPSTTSTLTF